jgi:hypothetical protein
MMNRGCRHGRGANLAVRGEHLVDGPEGPAAKLARHGIRAVEIGVDHAHQANRFALLLKLSIDPGVVASEDAHSHHRNGNRIVRLQKKTLGWPAASRNNKL